MSNVPAKRGGNAPTNNAEEREIVTATDRTRALKAKLDGNREAFEQALSGRIDPDRFLRIVANAYLGSSSLHGCAFLSVLTAALDAAEVGLKVDGEEAAIVPYRDRDSGEVIATFQPMYQGLIRLMLRAGASKVEAHVARSGDLFEYELGIEPKLRHVPAGSDERGDVTYAYAVVWLANGETQFEVIDRAELDKIRDSSPSKNSPAWRNYRDQMFRKIAVKRLRKYVELDSAASAAFRKDDLLEGGTNVALGDLDPRFERRSLEERAASHARREIATLGRAVDENRSLTSGDSSGDRVPSGGDEAAEGAAGAASDPVSDDEEESGDEPIAEGSREALLADFEFASEFEVRGAAETLDLDLPIPSGKYKGRTWREAIEEDAEYVVKVIRYGVILDDEGLRALAAHLVLDEEA